MKKVKWILITMMILVGSILYIWYQSDGTLIASPNKPVQQLLKYVKKEVPGKIVTPNTTAELQAWFSEATEQKIPRVFVTQLPPNFAEKGTPTLFVQVIAALIMRENEYILRERVALLALKDKWESGQVWTPVEQAFFDELVDKYDAVAERKIPSQIAELTDKVNVVPVTLGVAMAAEATDWGKRHMNSPFHQQGWLNHDEYGFLSFDSLLDATHSYVREVNSAPILMEWRMTRQQFRNMLDVNDVGYRSIRWMGSYLPDEIDYTDRVLAYADNLDSVSVDKLTFHPVPPSFDFRRSAITLQTQKGDFPIDVEVAESEQQRAHGLMFRTELLPDTGMLFILPDVRIAGVWMKNTFIPLDIVFYDENWNISRLISHAKPFDITLRSSVEPVAGMLELPAGSIDRFGIQKGDKIIYHDL